MSSIMIDDLAHNAAIERGAMSAVRGGSGPNVNAGGPNVNVNVTLDQQFAQFQKIGVDVLNNNGVIGAGLAGPNLASAAAQWVADRAVLPAS